MTGSALAIDPTLRLWRRGGLSWLELLRRAARGYRENHGDARSALFAYYSLLALFPFLILLIAALAHLPVTGVVENSLEAADRGLPHDMALLLARQVSDIQRHSTLGLIGINLLVLLIAGSRVFLTITSGLNLAYGVRESRRFWQVHGMAFGLTIAASLLVLGALLVMILGPMASEWVVEHQMEVGWLQVLLRRGVRWGVICVALWIYTSTIYWWGPSLKLPWYWLSPGSVAATAGWVIVTQGFRLYVENVARFNEIYGAIGGVIVLMVWLDLTGAVLLFGGHVNAAIHRAAAEQAAQPAPVIANP